MRLEVMQQIWGKGMSGPGDEEYILRLVKPLALNPAHTVIDVGAGLGGATRLIAEKFDIWITGLESDREVADKGMELSTMAGLATDRKSVGSGKGVSVRVDSGGGSTLKKKKQHKL